MLEKMGAFFDARLDGYEEHQLTCIESAQTFYPFTARCLPIDPGTHLLDLGCGTGLELEWYFRSAPEARVTGIDLSARMLEALRGKFSGKDLTLMQGSYFEVPLGKEVFDAAVSVESLHHFTKEEKLGLYRRLHAALKEGGRFVLTDYFADTDDQEQHFRQELLRLKAEQGLGDDVFYHYDTPLTWLREMEILREVGFREVTDLKRWGATHCIRALK